MLLHTDTFTHRGFYTQRLLHTDTFTQTKALRLTKKNRNFSSVFDVQRPFRAKGLRLTKKNRNFSSVFDVQRPFRV